MQDPLPQPSQSPVPLPTAEGATESSLPGLGSEGAPAAGADEQQKSTQAPDAGAVERAVAEIEHIVPLAPEKRSEVRRVVTSAVRQVRIEGPLPPPSILRQYGQIVPGSDRQIVAEFVADSHHARQISSSALNHQAADNRRQHWMAFTIIGLGYVMSLVFALLDKDALAALVLGTTIVGTVVAFLQNRQQAQKPNRTQEDDD